MSCCSTCGRTTIGGCSCNHIGCLGNILMFIGWIIAAGILCMMLTFFAPGLIINLALGRFYGTFEEFVNQSLKDRVTWVLSAAGWICVGIWRFYKSTKLPE